MSSDISKAAHEQIQLKAADSLGKPPSSVSEQKYGPSGTKIVDHRSGGRTKGVAIEFKLGDKIRDPEQMAEFDEAAKTKGDVFAKITRNKVQLRNLPGKLTQGQKSALYRLGNIGSRNLGVASVILSLRPVHLYTDGPHSPLNSELFLFCQGYEIGKLYFNEESGLYFTIDYALTTNDGKVAIGVTTYQDYERNRDSTSRSWRGQTVLMQGEVQFSKDEMTFHHYGTGEMILYRA